MPRVDFGNLELEIQPVSPFEILDEIKHQMTPLAKNKGLEFIIDCVGRLPEFINTDARRLRQIMSSLVNHAIKYTENGRVVVRPPAPSGRSRRCIGAGCDDVAEKPINRPLLFKMIQRLAQPGKAEVTEPIPQPAIDLTELQRDMLGEFLNMGLGNAADALSIMTGGEVELSIPKVEFVTPVELRERFTRLLGSELSIVQQRFTGSLEGEAFLLFSSSMVLEFVRTGSTSPGPERRTRARRSLRGGEHHPECLHECIQRPTGHGPRAAYTQGAAHPRT